MSTLLRIIHSQSGNVDSSILIDKIDRSQGNFSGYAYRAKQKIYVPYKNPVDPSVKGYIDLVPTDEVLLSWDSGTIAKLTEAGYVTRAAVAANSIAKATVNSASLAGGTVTITGTGFISINPDKTYVKIINTSGNSQMLVSTGNFSTFNSTTITFLANKSTIGPIGSGWSFSVLANSKYSNIESI